MAYFPEDRELFPDAPEYWHEEAWEDKESTEHLSSCTLIVPSGVRLMKARCYDAEQMGRLDSVVAVGDTGEATINCTCGKLKDVVVVYTGSLNDLVCEANHLDNNPETAIIYL